MFFKNLAICLLALALVTCARESTPSDPVVEVKLKGGGECLTEFGAHMNKFFKGQMARAEVIAFWDCTNQAVNDYQRLTSGDGINGDYSPQALRRFLYRYFFKTRPLSDTLLASLMDLKRVFLSGSVSEITSGELIRLQALIVELKLLSLEIHPHVLLLFGEQKGTDAEVSLAAQGFERATLRLGRWLDIHQEPYTFQQLESLLVAIAEWLAADGSSQGTMTSLSRVAQILPAAKKLMVSGNDSRIEGHKWLKLMQMGGIAFHIYLDFKHTFQEHMNAGMIRGLMPEAVGQVGLLLEQAIRERSGVGLPYEEWQELFRKIAASQFLPAEFTAEALNGLFVWGVDRLLDHGRQNNSLTSEHVGRLREQEFIWRNILARVNGQNFADVPEFIKFEEVLARSTPMQWDSEGRLQHSRRGLATWTQDSRRRMVWPWVLLNWVREGYLGTRQTMNETEISNAVKEILPMLQRFGWMSASKLSVGKRILREADLFTEASDGNFALDMAEATRYLAFVASGFRVAEVWLHEADVKCASRESECVRQIATDPSSRALEPLPHLKKHVLAQSPAHFVRYLQQAEETVLGSVTVGPMSTKNLMQAMMLLQYVETFLRLYDNDASEKINVVEAEGAFDKYGPTLAKLLGAGGVPRDEILALFTFMMKYGDTPFNMFGGQIRFNHWKWHRNDWVFAAERGTLMSILNQLSKL